MKHVCLSYLRAREDCMNIQAGLAVYFLQSLSVIALIIRRLHSVFLDNLTHFISHKSYTFYICIKNTYLFLLLDPSDFFVFFSCLDQLLKIQFNILNGRNLSMKLSFNKIWLHLDIFFGRSIYHSTAKLCKILIKWIFYFLRLHKNSNVNSLNEQNNYNLWDSYIFLISIIH